MLINLLVQNGSWYQLHQLLQYHVIADSKPLGKHYLKRKLNRGESNFHKYQNGIKLLTFSQIFSACLLLSLESVYPAAGQLAIDMLVRLKNSADEICEILLSKNRIISALQFASTQNLFSHEIGSVAVRTRKFLEASAHGLIDQDREKEAENKNERIVTFFTVYSFFQERNMLDRGCDQFKELYQKIVENS